MKTAARIIEHEATAGCQPHILTPGGQGFLFHIPLALHGLVVVFQSAFPLCPGHFKEGSNYSSGESRNQHTGERPTVPTVATLLVDQVNNKVAVRVVSFLLYFCRKRGICLAMSTTPSFEERTIRSSRFHYLPPYRAIVGILLPPHSSHEPQELEPVYLRFSHDAKLPPSCALLTCLCRDVMDEVRAVCI